MSIFICKGVHNTSGALWVSGSKLTCIVSLLAIGLAVTTGSYFVSAYVGPVVT